MNRSKSYTGIMFKAIELTERGYNIEALPELVEALNMVIYDYRTHGKILEDTFKQVKEALKKAKF